jgi:twitching motility two-component system response regulator PilG
MSTENKKLVWVEDDKLMIDLIDRKFSGKGFVLVNVSDGESAVKTIEQEMPDLIVLDIILPNINGFEILESLKKNNNTKNIPVIIFSNLGSDEDVEKAKKLGAVKFLVKAVTDLEDVRKEIVATIEGNKK